MKGACGAALPASRGKDWVSGLAVGGAAAVNRPAPHLSASPTSSPRARGEGTRAVTPILRRERRPGSASCACGQSGRPCRRTSALMLAAAAGARRGGDADDRQGSRQRRAENDDDGAQSVVEHVSLLNESPNRLVGLCWRLTVWVRPPRGALVTDRSSLSSMASTCRSC